MKLSIRAKLVFLVLFILLLTAGLISYQNLSFFQRDKETYVFDLINQLSEVQSKELDRKLMSLQQLMQIFADFSTYQLSVSERQRFLEKYSDFLFIGTFELRSDRLKDGLVIADRRRLQSVGYTADQIKKDKRMLQLATNLKGFSALNATMQEHAATVMFLTPASNNRFVLGVLPQSAVLNLSKSKKVYDSYVVDRSGELVMHPVTMNLLRRDSFANRPAVKAWMNNPKLPLTKEFDMDGKATLVSYSSISEGFGFFIELPKEQAFVAAKRLMKTSGMWAAIIFAASCFLGLMFAYSITRPLKSLGKLTGEIAKGNFSVKAKVKSNDEIGDLVKSFNTMSDELDIREKKLEETHKQLVQSEKMGAFGQMSAGIAHEVKNPLAGILGYAQMSKRKIEKDSPIVKYIEIIEKETKRCKEIIENLMKFARQEESEFKQFNINQAVRDAVQLVDHQITLSGVKIAQEVADDANIPEVIGNANQIQQVLMNLMINAQHAMEDKGTLTVRTSANGNQMVTIEIVDTGKGIEQEHLAKIFEPFFTTKPAGQGTGLGLAVSYGIIKDHHGEINVDSKVGEGTTFTITLPTIGHPEAPEPTNA